MSDEPTSPEAAVRAAAAAGHVALLHGQPLNAEVLRELVTQIGPGRSRGVRVHGARLEGRLDLSAADLSCTLMLAECTIEEGIDLTDATGITVAITGGLVGFMRADGLRLRGDLLLNRGLELQRGCRLNRARIDGQLDFSDTTIGATSGIALQAQDLRVGAGVTATGLRTSGGAIDLIDCDIGSHLDLSGTRLGNGQLALVLDRASVGGSLFLTSNALVDGVVTMVNAKIGGSAMLSDAHFWASGPPTVVSNERLRLDGTVVTGGLGIVRSSVEGVTSLVGTHVGSHLTIQASTLRRSDHTAPGADYAVMADRLMVDGSVFIGADTSIRGGITLRSSRIGGQLSVNGANVVGGRAQAFNLDRASISSNLSFMGSTEIHGELRLVGISVGGQLALRDALLYHPGGIALAAEQAKIALSVLCRSGTRIYGCSSFLKADIGSSLTFHECTLRAPGQVALQAQGCKAAHEIVLLPSEIDGAVDLRRATTGTLRDDRRTWPTILGLTGLQYDALEAANVSARERLAWLELEPGGYAPQPYEQLAAAYRRAGWEEDARKVVVAKRRRRRTEQNATSKAWDRLLDVTIQYGYASWRAALGLLVLAAAGAIVFASEYPDHFTPAKSSDTLPPFHSIVYALDVLVPVISLRQRDAWTPHGYALIWSVGLTFAGWILTTAVVAALSGLLRRD